MTKIGEEYSLSSISVKTFFNLPISSGKNNCFLINDGRNSVVKVQDHKLLHNWTLSHPNSFTSPVTVDDDTGAMYGVMNCNTLLMWSIEDDTLNEAAMFKFKESIFAVLPVCGMKPIVLFTSGRVLQSETLPSTELIGTKFLSETEEIIWADATNIQSKKIVVCLSASNKGETYKLHSFAIEKNNVSGYFDQTLVQESDVIKSWCLNKSASSFFSVWSSGLILYHQIDSPSQSTLLTIPGIQDFCLLAMDCIDSNHIALVKCNPKMKESILEIWDVQFMALKATKALKSASPSSIRLFATDSIIFLSYNEELIEVSFHLEKSTLAAAMGSSTMSAPKVKEFSWKKGELSEVAIDEQNVVEKMDTSGTKNTLNTSEIIAQRLMEEGTAYLKYIPESELISLLLLAIRRKCTKERKNMKIKPDAIEFEPDAILTAIFSSSFSDVFLLKYMKILNSEEALMTLETLISLLKNKSTTSSASCANNPTDVQILGWICLIVQSHIEAFLLSKDEKIFMLLKELENCFREKVTEYEDYESIQNALYIIQRKKNILPEKHVDPRYSIEILDA